MVTIYAIVDPRNNQVRYVGKTVDLERRSKTHVRDARRLKGHKNNWLRGIEAGGYTPTFLVLEEVSTEDWKESERFWIAYLKYLGANLLNLTEGGDDNGKTGLKASDETKAKLSALRQGTGNPMYGKSFTAETKAKMSIKKVGEAHHNWGKKHSDNVRENMRKSALRGENGTKAKLTEEEAKQILRVYLSTDSLIKDLPRPSGVGYSTIRALVKGVTWKHLDYLRNKEVA